MPKYYFIRNIGKLEIRMSSSNTLTYYSSISTVSRLVLNNENKHPIVINDFININNACLI